VSTEISQVFGNYNSATSKGTKIMKPGADMDKNTFLKILAAELSNQDPMAAKDSTQYVSQMAQFASMEQMANLNATMSTSAANTDLLAAASMIGKIGEFSIQDENGSNLTGLINGIVKENGLLKLRVQQQGSDEIKTMSLEALLKLDMVK
jgi:flagellar basal-body rod modification protein FlgD